MNAGNAEYSVSTALTRLDKVRYVSHPTHNVSHFGFDPPIFFMNTITSDLLKLPLASDPIVT